MPKKRKTKHAKENRKSVTHVFAARSSRGRRRNETKRNTDETNKKEQRVCVCYVDIIIKLRAGLLFSGTSESKYDAARRTRRVIKSKHCQRASVALLCRGQWRCDDWKHLRDSKPVGRKIRRFGAVVHLLGQGVRVCVFSDAPVSVGRVL